MIPDTEFGRKFKEMHGNFLAEISHEKWKELFMSDPVDHDDAACQAMIDYEKSCRQIESQVKPFSKINPKTPLMYQFADKYNVSVKRMQEHWRCVERVLGKDPLDIR